MKNDSTIHLERNPSLYKKFAKKALETAKSQEQDKKESGKKWVLLPDGKTRVLR